MAKLAVSAGVKERAIAIANAEAELVVKALERTLSSAQFNLTDTQKAAGRKLIAHYLRNPAPERRTHGDHQTDNPTQYEGELQRPVKNPSQASG